MAGPIEIIRKNSVKIKRKLSKSDRHNTNSSLSSRGHKGGHHERGMISPVSSLDHSPSRMIHSVSFDLSPHDGDEFQTHYSPPQRRAIFNLGNQSSPSLHAQHMDHSLRNSLDHSGDVIQVKRRNLPSSGRKSEHRKTFDFAAMNSKTRPTSLIVDDKLLDLSMNNESLHSNALALISQNQNTNSLNQNLTTNSTSNRSDSKVTKSKHSTTSPLDNHGIIIGSSNNEILATHSTANFLFAFFFHLFNIFFGICIYLPLYIIFKLGFVSVLALSVSLYIWYSNTTITINTQPSPTFN
ncbi:hypothetical protein CAS74_004167 [Pichia kudriavzevii]|uniref:Uncharacterized protein n=1 Tax=Pichia kudriavzevii TaxID=4909 RepID=A0A1Z8JIW6_PICKU|nr:hypothetical protein CAS74_004167 [Pichia kudriavzevii]